MTAARSDGGARRVLLSLGSNLGDRRRFLADAVASLGAEVVGVSPVYETDPVGGVDQGAFLNLVVELRTARPARDLLGVCHRLETAAERVRQERWGPRTLDVDIVWIDGERIDEPNLVVPHPRWTDRRFVLVPLADVAPDLVAPGAVDAAEGDLRRWGTLDGPDAPG